MDLDKLNANHIEVLNHELGTVKLDIGIIKNDIVWIKGHLWGLWIPLLLLIIGTGIQLLK